MKREKKRYTMDQEQDGSWSIINPYNGCSIYTHGSKEKVEQVLAECNGEKYQPSF